VENAAAVRAEWLAGVRSVGLSSGASVPEVLVTEVLAWLAERGYPDVETVTGAEERLVFALPPELRRELRAAEAAGSTGTAAGSTDSAAGTTDS
jgi:4-hydroxy-3-methylbut-2-enyl diphosphate reductase